MLSALQVAALTVVEPIIGVRPRAATAHLRALVESGDTERALLRAHDLLLRWPDEPWIHFHAGRAATHKSMLTLAKVRFAHAASLAPEEPTFRFALGYALREIGEPEGAAREYRAALRFAAHDARVHYNLGVVERECGRPEASRESLEQAVALRARDGRAWYLLGVVYYELRRPSDAAGALRRALKIQKRHVRARYHLGLALVAAGDEEDGIESLRAALQEDPAYGPAHYALGVVLGDRKPVEARRHLKEAILGTPPVPKAHFALGRQYRRAGRLEEARRELTLHLRNSPDDARARRMLARVEAELG